MNKMKKISVVGAGNASIVTALNLYLCGKILSDTIEEIEICYDPNTKIEKVGQGTTVSVTQLIGKMLNISLYQKDNPIKATIKDGILYKNWKNVDEILHPFPMSSKSIHFVPSLLSDLVLESKMFKVVEKNINNPEEEIDSDLIFDCRGRKNRDPEDYYELINPTNSVLLGRKNDIDLSIKHTECIATPDGWTFVIPNTDGVSYGYLYNDTITTDEQAKKNFEELFRVLTTDSLKFDNYVAKSMWKGDRTILNGNRFCFLEPLEATSVEIYLTLCRDAWAYIEGRASKDQCDYHILNYVKQIETFVLWHYQDGSKYDTPFWDYAKSLPFDPDPTFKEFLDLSRKYDYNELAFDISNYGQWSPYNFKIWDGANQNK